MNSTHSLFVIGATSTLAAVAALLFFRFFRRTRDPLFIFFFDFLFAQAIGRVLIVIIGPISPTGAMEPEENFVLLYILRLAAYGLIVFAIIHKNWSRRSASRRI